MKKIIIGAVSAGAVLIVAVIALVIFMNSDSDSYREIKIYKVDGSTNVERAGDIKMDAYENMQLQNEDYVNVLADSYTQLKMDEDKYALLEPDTRIGIEATGNAVDSKTKIKLEYGTIVSHLEHKLSEKSSYEVNTPNSTMAVRGTSFRVTTYYDEAGVSYTILEVIEGVVAVRLVYPDGSVSDERLVYAGRKIMIRGDSLKSEYVYEDGEVELTEYNIPVLDFLKIHFNEEYYCTEDDINRAIQHVSDSEKQEQDGVANDDESENSIIESPAPDSNSQDKGKAKDASDAEYTVIFSYEGQIFATQTVKKGGKVNEPALQPAPAGSWDYDFDNTVESDITINWVE